MEWSELCITFHEEDYYFCDDDMSSCHRTMSQNHIYTFEWHHYENHEKDRTLDKAKRQRQ